MGEGRAHLNQELSLRCPTMTIWTSHTGFNRERRCVGAVAQPGRSLWLPAVALGGGSLIAAGALAWNQPVGSGTAVFFGFLMLIVIFNVANAIAAVRHAYRAAERNRYVLTNRRAAVFETPGHLLTQTRVGTLEFQATRSPLTRGGDIIWGESEYEGSDVGPIAAFLRTSSLRHAPVEGKVVFAELGNFDAAYNMAVAVRADSGSKTPRPVDPRMRAEPPVALGVLDSTLAGVLNTTAICVGSFTVVCVVFLLGWTLLGPARNFMPRPAAVLFVFIFPLFFWAIAISIGRPQRAGKPCSSPGEEVADANSIRALESLYLLSTSRAGPLSRWSWSSSGAGFR